MLYFSSFSAFSRRTFHGTIADNDGREIKNAPTGPRAFRVRSRYQEPAMPKIPRIAVLLQTDNAFGRGLARGVAQYARLHGPWSFYRMPPFYRQQRQGLSKNTLAKGRTWQADAVIAHVNRPEEQEDFRLMQLPAVVTYVREPVPGIINIHSDNDALGRLAAEHLLERGLKNFAYCGFDDMCWSAQRQHSFTRRLHAANRRVHSYHQPAEMDHRLWQEKLQHMADWAASLPKPLGVMACNDSRAQDLTEACKMADIDIPEEVAVIGVDNDEGICQLCDPPLTSIAQNTERAGYEAAEVLERIMRGQTPPGDQIVVPPGPVVVRQSTDMLAVQDKAVADAIRYIHRHTRDLQQVQEVANAVGLSLRQLQKRFSRALGWRISDEIRRTRVQRACQLLIETNMPMAKVADAIGYAEPTNLARFFRRETGMSLLQYRKKYGRK